MANNGRVLLAATVTDVGQGPFVYPACDRCYRKLTVSQEQGRHLYRCQECRRVYSSGEMSYRYRLCLTVTDSTTLASVTGFGGMLNSFFGVTATDFQNTYLSTLRAKFGTSSDNIMQIAVEQVLIGQRLLFGLKPAPPNHGRLLHTKNRGTILKDICQNSDAFSQKTTTAARHISDFIAVQILRQTDFEAATTVVECLQYLLTTLDDNHLTPNDCADKATLQQLLNLCSRYDNQDSCVSNNLLVNSAVASPTCSPVDVLLDLTTDEQSSLQFSCDRSQEAGGKLDNSFATICEYQVVDPLCQNDVKTLLSSQEDAKTHLFHQEIVKTYLSTQNGEKTHLSSQNGEKTRLSSQNDVKTRLSSQNDVKTHLYSQNDVKTHLSSHNDVKTHLSSQENAKTHLFHQEDVKTRLFHQEDVKTRLSCQEEVGSAPVSPSLVNSNSICPASMNTKFHFTTNSQEVIQAQQLLGKRQLDHVRSRNTKSENISQLTTKRKQRERKRSKKMRTVNVEDDVIVCPMMHQLLRDHVSCSEFEVEHSGGSPGRTDKFRPIRIVCETSRNNGSERLCSDNSREFEINNAEELRMINGHLSEPGVYASRGTNCGNYNVDSTCTQLDCRDNATKDEGWLVKKWDLKKREVQSQVKDRKSFIPNSDIKLPRSDQRTRTPAACTGRLYPSDGTFHAQGWTSQNIYDSSIHSVDRSAHPASSSKPFAKFHFQNSPHKENKKTASEIDTKCKKMLNLGKEHGTLMENKGNFDQIPEFSGWEPKLAGESMEDYPESEGMDLFLMQFSNNCGNNCGNNNKNTRIQLKTGDNFTPNVEAKLHQSIQRTNACKIRQGECNRALSIQGDCDHSICTPCSLNNSVHSSGCTESLVKPNLQSSPHKENNKAPEDALLVQKFKNNGYKVLGNSADNICNHQVSESALWGQEFDGELMEDFPESEGFEMFLTGLSSNCIKDRRSTQIKTHIMNNLAQNTRRQTDKLEPRDLYQQLPEGKSGLRNLSGLGNRSCDNAETHIATADRAEFPLTSFVTGSISHRKNHSTPQLVGYNSANRASCKNFDKRAKRTSSLKHHSLLKQTLPNKLKISKKQPSQNDKMLTLKSQNNKMLTLKSQNDKILTLKSQNEETLTHQNSPQNVSSSKSYNSILSNKTEVKQKSSLNVNRTSPKFLNILQKYNLLNRVNIENRQNKICSFRNSKKQMFRRKIKNVKIILSFKEKCLVKDSFQRNVRNPKQLDGTSCNVKKPKRQNLLHSANFRNKQTVSRIVNSSQKQRLPNIVNRKNENFLKNIKYQKKPNLLQNVNNSIKQTCTNVNSSNNQTLLPNVNSKTQICSSLNVINPNIHTLSISSTPINFSNDSLSQNFLMSSNITIRRTKRTLEGKSVSLHDEDHSSERLFCKDRIEGKLGEEITQCTCKRFLSGAQCVNISSTFKCGHCMDGFSFGSSMMSEKVDGSSEKVDGSSEMADGSSEKVDGSSEKVDGASETVDGASEKVDGSSEKVDGSSFGSSVTSEKVDGASETVDGASETVDGAPETVDGASETVDGASEKVDDSSEKVDGASETVDGASEKVDGASETVDGLSEKLDGASETVDGSSEKVDAGEFGSSVMFEKVAGASEKVDGASEKVDGASEKVAGSSEKVDVSPEKVDGASEKVDGASEKVAGSSEKVDGWSEKVDGASEKVDGASEKVDGSSEKVDGSSEKVDGSSEKVDDSSFGSTMACTNYFQAESSSRGDLESQPEIFGRRSISFEDSSQCTGQQGFISTDSLQEGDERELWCHPPTPQKSSFGRFKMKKPVGFGWRQRGRGNASKKLGNIVQLVEERLQVGGREATECGSVAEGLLSAGLHDRATERSLFGHSSNGVTKSLPCVSSHNGGTKSLPWVSSHNGGTKSLPWVSSHNGGTKSLPCDGSHNGGTKSLPCVSSHNGGTKSLPCVSSHNGGTKSLPCDGSHNGGTKSLPCVSSHNGGTKSLPCVSSHNGGTKSLPCVSSHNGGTESLPCVGSHNGGTKSLPCDGSHNGGTKSLPCDGSHNGGTKSLPCVSSHNGGTKSLPWVSSHNGGTKSLPCDGSHNGGTKSLPCDGSHNGGTKSLPCVSSHNGGTKSLPCVSSHNIGTKSLPCDGSHNGGTKSLPCVSSHNGGTKSLPWVSSHNGGTKSLPCVSSHNGGTESLPCVGSHNGGTKSLPCDGSHNGGTKSLPCVGSHNGGTKSLSCVSSHNGGTKSLPCDGSHNGGTKSLPCVSSHNGGTESLPCVSSHNGGTKSLSCVSSHNGGTKSLPCDGYRNRVSKSLLSNNSNIDGVSEHLLPNNSNIDGVSEHLLPNNSHIDGVSEHLLPNNSNIDEECYHSLSDNSQDLFNSDEENLVSTVDKTSVHIRSQKYKCETFGSESIGLQTSQATSIGDLQENWRYSLQGHPRRKSGRRVKFSNRKLEHYFFGFDIISHLPVAVGRANPNLKPSLKRRVLDSELSGSQDLFSESSDDNSVFCVSPEIKPETPSSEKWDSSGDLFSQCSGKEQTDTKDWSGLSVVESETVNYADFSGDIGRSPRKGKSLSATSWDEAKPDCVGAEELKNDGSFDLFMLASPIGWETNLSPVSAGKNGPPDRTPGSPREIGRSNHIPASPREIGRPNYIPSSPREIGRPNYIPSSPREIGRPNYIPSSPREIGRPNYIPSSPREIGRPNNIPASPREIGRTNHIPASPREIGRTNHIPDSPREIGRTSFIPVSARNMNRTNHNAVSSRKINRTNHTPVSSRKVNRTNHTPVSSRKVNRTNHTPVSSRKVNRTNHTPVSSREVNRTSYIPVSTRKISRTNFTPVSSREVNRTSYIPVSTRKISRTNFTPVSSRDINKTSYIPVSTRKISRTNFTPVSASKMNRTSQIPVSARKIQPAACWSQLPVTSLSTGNCTLNGCDSPDLFS